MNKTNHPKKQFCKYGHNIFEVGRGKNGGCNTCNSNTGKYTLLRKEYKKGPHKEWVRRDAKERRDRARKELNDYKTNRGCIECGEKDYRVLDFDHLTDKKFTISQALCTTEEKLWTEIAKCEVVCANHHRIRTWERSH